jgi:hypothetical protein
MSNPPDVPDPDRPGSDSYYYLSAAQLQEIGLTSLSFGALIYKMWIEIPQNLKIESPYHPPIPPLGKCPKNKKVGSQR